MSVSNIINFSWSAGSANALTQSVTSSANTLLIDSFVAESDATTEVVLAFQDSDLESIFVLSDVAVIFKTNDPDTPQDEFAIGAGCPFVWYRDSGLPNPFSGNVTSTFWEVNEEDDASIQVRLLYDA